MLLSLVKEDSILSTGKGEKTHFFSIRVVERVRGKSVPTKGHLVTKVRTFQE